MKIDFDKLREKLKLDFKKSIGTDTLNNDYFIDTSVDKVTFWFKENLPEFMEEEWISIEDGMPENVGWYQVYTNDGFILTAGVAVNGWWTIPFGGHYGDMGPPFIKNSKENEREVTHWKPLPQLPKAKEQ